MLYTTLLITKRKLPGKGFIRNPEKQVFVPVTLWTIKRYHRFMKDYSFWIIDHKDFPDGWMEGLTLNQISTITESITGLGLKDFMIEPFREIHFCGDNLRARVEKSTGTLQNLTLQLRRYSDSTWEVYVDWKPETHRVEFRENTDDVEETLEWIFKVIGYTIPSAIVPITKEYPGLE
jgi:hypothetical protein